MSKKLVSIVIGVITLISICGCGPSKEEKTMAEEACKNFIEKEMWVFTDDKDGPKIFDTYTKKGKIVVEVGYKLVEYQGSDKAYSVRLCVVDLEKETISLPSPINDSEWKK